MNQSIHSFSICTLAMPTFSPQEIHVFLQATQDAVWFLHLAFIRWLPALSFSLSHFRVSIPLSTKHTTPLSLWTSIFSLNYFRLLNYCICKGVLSWERVITSKIISSCTSTFSKDNHFFTYQSKWVPFC